MQDHDWCEEARISLAKHRAVLDASLHTLGLDVIGGTDLFRLVKHNDAALIWETLGQSGILTRVFDYDPTWLRIGLPANQKGIDRLLRAFG
jgi:cobalamin biosynthetic protein CobC